MGFLLTLGQNRGDGKYPPVTLRNTQPSLPHTSNILTNTCIGELAYNLTTKIITLLEFFNFVSEVSRLQYE
jgi:hypothetical protein